MEIWAATRDPAAAGHPFPAPYSVQTLRDELQMRPVIVADGELTRSSRSRARRSASSRSRSGARTGSTRSTPSSRRCRRASPSLREASFRLCLVAGAAREAARARGRRAARAVHRSRRSRSPSTRSSCARERARVVGTTVTRGGSAKSTSEPAARAALEIAEGRLSAPGRQAAGACDRGARGVSRAAATRRCAGRARDLSRSL